MIDKDSTTTDKYRLNDRTSVIVKNSKIEQDDGSIRYHVYITLKHYLSTVTPLTFNDNDEVADFIGNIDYDNPQLSLPGMDRKDLN